jgi:magnesium chelatase subunit I
MEGKVEIEALEEGREERILQGLVSSAVLSVYRSLVDPETVAAIPGSFEESTVVHAGDDLELSAYAEALEALEALQTPVMALARSENPAVVASAVELVLEGLHLTKRLNKEASGPRATYRGRLSR